MSLTTEVLAADDVTVELGGLPVLRGVSLQVAAGQAVALMGGNGSGKSTLVKSLLGLIPTQRGSIRLFGQPLAGFRQWSRVGYVPQRSTLALGTAKVKEVVASGRLARRTPFRPLSRSDRATVADSLQSVGLAERANHQITHLSGGQQQRAMIARALAGEPELLILDEPTVGVDLEHQRVLAGLLAGSIATGTSVLVVLHEVGALGPLIGRAVVLREGRVAYDGERGNLGHHDHVGRHELGEPTPDPGWLEGPVWLDERAEQ